MSDGKARILNPPARIWLVYGGIPYDLEHDSFDAEDLTWCYERTGDSDVEYVHVAEVERLTAELDGLAKALRNLVKMNVEHNEAVEAVIGRPVNWSDNYLDEARAALDALENGGTE